MSTKHSTPIIPKAGCQMGFGFSDSSIAPPVRFVSLVGRLNEEMLEMRGDLQQVMESQEAAREAFTADVQALRSAMEEKASIAELNKEKFALDKIAANLQNLTAEKTALGCSPTQKCTVEVLAEDVKGRGGKNDVSIVDRPPQITSVEPKVVPEVLSEQWTAVKTLTSDLQKLTMATTKDLSEQRTVIDTLEASIRGSVMTAINNLAADFQTLSNNMETKTSVHARAIERLASAVGRKVGCEDFARQAATIEMLATSVAAVLAGAEKEEAAKGVDGQAENACQRIAEELGRRMNLLEKHADSIRGASFDAMRGASIVPTNWTPTCGNLQDNSSFAGGNETGNAKETLEVQQIAVPMLAADVQTLANAVELKNPAQEMEKQNAKMDVSIKMNPDEAPTNIRGLDPHLPSNSSEVIAEVLSEQWATLRTLTTDVQKLTLATAKDLSELKANMGMREDDIRVSAVKAVNTSEIDLRNLGSTVETRATMNDLRHQDAAVRCLSARVHANTSAIETLADAVGKNGVGEDIRRQLRNAELKFGVGQAGLMTPTDWANIRENHKKEFDVQSVSQVGASASTQPACGSAFADGQDGPPTLEFSADMLSGVLAFGAATPREEGMHSLNPFVVGLDTTIASDSANVAKRPSSADDRGLAGRIARQNAQDENALDVSVVSLSVAREASPSPYEVLCKSADNGSHVVPSMTTATPASASLPSKNPMPPDFPFQKGASIQLPPTALEQCILPGLSTDSTLLWCGSERTLGTPFTSPRKTQQQMVRCDGPFQSPLPKGDFHQIVRGRGSLQR